MKKFLSLLFLLSTAGVCLAADQASSQVPGQVSGAGVKIGYVRVERLLNVEKLDEATHEWRDRVKELQAELEMRTAKLMAEKQKFEKEAAEFSDPSKNKWLTDAAREAKQDELVKKRDELNAAANQVRDYEQRISRKLQTEMLAKIERAANKIGEKQNLDLVFYSGAIYIAKRVDVTEEVMSVLNKDYDAEKAKKSAPKPATTPVSADKKK